MDENISFLIDDDDKTETNSFNSENLNDYQNTDEIMDFDTFFIEQDMHYSKEIDYDMNYTVNQLLLICDFYDLVKELKLKKCNKQTIIQVLVNFENNIKNEEIVSKRKLFWFYINELKNDKFMKKFILC